MNKGLAVVMLVTMVVQIIIGMRVDHLFYGLRTGSYNYSYAQAKFALRLYEAGIGILIVIATALVASAI